MTDKQYFQQEYDAWKNETQFQSVGNYDNQHFQNIVSMKENASPFILQILQNNEPNMIVHALDFIYPDEVTYHGYTPLEFVCETWKTILTLKLNKTE